MAVPVRSRLRVQNRKKEKKLLDLPVFVFLGHWYSEISIQGHFSNSWFENFHLQNQFFPGTSNQVTESCIQSVLKIKSPAYF